MINFLKDKIDNLNVNLIININKCRLMNKIILAFLAILIVFTHCPYSYGCDEEEVKKVQNYIDSINNSSASFSNIKKALSSGETLTAFYLDGKLVKILVKDNKKGSSKSYELYFNNNSLIYIYEAQKKILTSGVSKNNNYYFFKDVKMICWQKNDKSYAEEDDIYSITEKNLLAKVEKYLIEIQ